MKNTTYYDVSHIELEIKKQIDFTETLKEIRRSIKRNRMTLESRIFYDQTIDRLKFMGIHAEYMGTYHCIFEGGRDSKKYKLTLTPNHEKV